jgi:nitrate reductase delta subunit
MTSAVVDQQSTVVAAPDRARLFELSSALLTYPDRDLLAAHVELAAAAAAIADVGTRELLDGFLAWLSSTPGIEVERHYVWTFDLRRRSGLFLTYYLHGDTRKRGIALVTLKQRYRAHGLTLAPGELPDYLPVVLEFASVAGPGDGEAPLRQHRRGLELLRVALEEAGSPYRYVVEAIARALPPLTAADRAAIEELGLEGPPVESVGLDPYGSAPTACEFASPPDHASVTDDLARIGQGPHPTYPDTLRWPA